MLVMTINKRDLLNNLKGRMLADDSLPLKETATNLVFGEGNINPKIYFLGEAPGRFEDMSGKPFVGPAGKLLEKLLEGIGLTRDDVYITSIIRYRPPKNRDPKPAEIEEFRPYLDEELSILQPKLIATLGRFSLQKFFPGEKISQIHGKPRKIKLGAKEVIVFPLYHPAAALRIQSLKPVLDEDFMILKKLLH